MVFVEVLPPEPDEFYVPEDVLVLEPDVPVFAVAPDELVVPEDALVLEPDVFVVVPEPDVPVVAVVPGVLVVAAALMSGKLVASWDSARIAVTKSARMKVFMIRTCNSNYNLNNN